MTTERKEYLEAHKADAKRRIFKAHKELARLAAERQDAFDRNDRNELTTIGKLAFEANKTILQSNKAIKEIDAELETA